MKALISLLAVLSLAGCGLKEAKLKDQQNILKLIAERGTELDRCYAKALEKNPSLASGSITVRADQHIDGSLHSTRLVKGFAASNEVMDCVAEKVNSWKTEPPLSRGPVDITWAFNNSAPSRAQAQADFGSLLKNHEVEFKECFKEHLKSEGEAQWGKIRFQFIRSSDGKIKNLEKLEGFKGSDKVFSCMATIMKTWQLGRTAENVNMTWSYQFNQELD